MTITEIQRRYPRPEACDGETESYRTCGYCVGGALLMCLRQYSTLTTFHPSERFPSEEGLAKVLQHYNGHLNAAQAYVCASGIISANDRKEFDVAWERAHAAIIYQP